MNKKQKKVFKRILVAAFLFILCKVIHFSTIVNAMLSLTAYFVIGYDILLKAWKGIKHHQVFDENFLMAVATVGAK